MGKKSSPKRPDRLCPTGALSAGPKRFGRDADHAPVKNELNSSSTFPYPFVTCMGTTLSLLDLPFFIAETISNLLVRYICWPSCYLVFSVQRLSFEYSAAPLSEPDISLVSINFMMDSEWVEEEVFWRKMKLCPNIYIRHCRLFHFFTVFLFLSTVLDDNIQPRRLPPENQSVMSLWMPPFIFVCCDEQKICVV